MVYGASNGVFWCKLLKPIIKLIKPITIHHFCRGRSSRPDVFFKKGVLINFVKFTGKHQCQSLFFNKVCNFI